MRVWALICALVFLAAVAAAPVCGAACMENPAGTSGCPQHQKAPTQQNSDGDCLQHGHAGAFVVTAVPIGMAPAASPVEIVPAIVAPAPLGSRPSPVADADASPPPVQGALRI